MKVAPVVIPVPGAPFDTTVAASTGDYLDVRLGAASGPLGTTDYRFRVQAMPLDAQHSLLHLAYRDYDLRRPAFPLP